MPHLLDIEQLGATLDATRHDLFRWEALRAYEVATDGSDYRRYLDGAAEPTWERKRAWMNTLAAWAAEGRARRRARLVHCPITDYQRYACEWGYSFNSASGEQIRVLDLAETAVPLETAGLPDFWLVDHIQPVVMHYGSDGHYLGAEVVPAAQADRYVAAATAAWTAGQDFDTWWQQHPEHHRTAHHAA